MAPISANERQLERHERRRGQERDEQTNVGSRLKCRGIHRAPSTRPDGNCPWRIKAPATGAECGLIAKIASAQLRGPCDAIVFQQWQWPVAKTAVFGIVTVKRWEAYEGDAGSTAVVPAAGAEH